MVSCHKETSNEKLNISNFNYLGMLHNRYLENVENNFSPDYSITNVDRKIDQITNFHINYTATLQISNDKKQILNESLNKSNNFVIQHNIASYFTGSYTRSEQIEENHNIFHLQQLYQSGKISNTTYQILLTLSTNLKDNLEGRLSDNDFKNSIGIPINQYNSLGYETNTEGEMIGAILSIAEHSIEYWEENDTGYTSGRTFAIPVWAAADIAGAVVSGVISASGQAAINGEINGNVVAWSAVGGAITSSTGLVGKIVRWLT